MVVALLCIILVVASIVGAMVYFGYICQSSQTAAHAKGRRLQRVLSEEPDDDDDDEDEDVDDDDDDDDDDDESIETPPRSCPQSTNIQPASTDEAVEPALGVIQASVELRDEVHDVRLPCEGVTSWAAFSQLVHEVCEDSGVPNLPVLGTMHIVLNVNGEPLPVTGSTPLSALRDATALRVTIGTDDTPASENPDQD